MKGGDEFSLNVAHWDFPLSTTVSAGPSWRQIIDLSNLANSVYVCPMCSSGNMLSNAYTTQLEAWANGQYFPMNTRGYRADVMFVLLPKKDNGETFF